MSGRGASGRPTWGEARKGRRELRPRARQRCPGRQEHRWWRAGRPRCACIGVSGKDPDADGSGQRRPPPEGSRATSSAARVSRGGTRPIPVVSLQTGVATRATQRPGGGPAESRSSGGVPGLPGRQRGRLLPPGVRLEPAARSASRGAGASLQAAPRSPCGLSTPGAREAAWAPEKVLPGWPALADASVRPEQQSPSRIRRDGGPSTLAARPQRGRRLRAGGAPRGGAGGSPAPGSWKWRSPCWGWAPSPRGMRGPTAGGGGRVGSPGS